MLKQDAPTEPAPFASRDWLRILARYREPNLPRSLFELALTSLAFVALWVVAWLSLSVSYWLTLAISIPAAGFLLRLFTIQHDCGHGSFFRRRFMNDWVGRVLGVFLLTPYAVWRHSHALHHATSGNLDKRGYGDIDILTVREFEEASRWRRLAYRLYRHPLVLFGIGPTYNFLIRNRLPLGFMDQKRYWISAMGTNLAMGAVVGVMIYAIGTTPFLLVQLPITLLASSIGVWLFYIQHQFEDTFWAGGEEWKMQDAALYGSSHYALPRVLSWMSANISVHHVHHLCSRIPSYRLPQVLRDYPELAAVRRLTMRESLACSKLKLWDEKAKKLVPFAKHHGRKPATPAS